MLTMADCYTAADGQAEDRQRGLSAAKTKTHNNKICSLPYRDERRSAGLKWAPHHFLTSYWCVIDRQLVVMWQLLWFSSPWLKKREIAHCWWEFSNMYITGNTYIHNPTHIFTAFFRAAFFRNWVFFDNIKLWIL